MNWVIMRKFNELLHPHFNSFEAFTTKTFLTSLKKIEKYFMSYLADKQSSPKIKNESFCAHIMSFDIHIRTPNSKFKKKIIVTQYKMSIGYNNFKHFLQSFHIKYLNTISNQHISPNDAIL